MPSTRRTLGGMVATTTALLLPLAHGPGFGVPSWTPKAALALVLGGAGLAHAPGALRRPATRRAAVAGLAFLAVAAASTALSANPSLALFGSYGSGTGLLFVAVLLGAWALGASTCAGDRRWLVIALLAGVLTNAAVAVLQLALSLDSFGLGLFDARSTGIMGNPVQLAALLTGGLALAVPLFQDRPRAMAGPVLLLSAALQGSGSRIALALCGAGLAALLLLRRSRKEVLLVGLVAAGVAVGSLVGQAQGAATGSDRLQEGVADDSTRARLYSWADAGQAVAAQPLLGAGPGRYLAATTPHRNLGLARVNPVETFFRDGHNLFVEYAVTTGLAGAAALAAFLALAWRGAQGPLAWFAVGVLLIGLLQPLFVGTTPLAFLALGAAGVPAEPGSRVRPWQLAPLIASFLAATMLVAGDLGVKSARLDGDPEAVITAGRWLPPWPETASVAGRLFVVEARVPERDAEFLRALRWHEAAVERDPEDPRWLNDLGALELAGRNPTRARRAFLQALTLAPHSRGALSGLARTASAVGDETEFRLRRDQLLRVIGEQAATAPTG